MLSPLKIERLFARLMFALKWRRAFTACGARIGTPMDSMTFNRWTMVMERRGLAPKVRRAMAAIAMGNKGKV